MHQQTKGRGRWLQRPATLLLSAALALAGLVAAPPPVVAAPTIYPTPLPQFATGQAPNYPLFTPTGGTTSRKGLVIYVRLTGTTPVLNRGEAWLAKRYFGPRPSVASYFKSQSGNRLKITPVAETGGRDNDGVVLVEGGSASIFFQGGDQASGRMIATAIRLAERKVNFRSADRDGNGRITSDELMLAVVWDANPIDNGARSRGHEPVTVDGKAVTLDLASLTTMTQDLMTVIHEAGHVLTSMRDLYGYGVSRFALSGTTGGPDAALQGANVYEKMHLGWSRPQVVTRDGYYNIPRTDRGFGGFLLYDPARGTDDYLMVENRQPTANTDDAAGPDRGLLVWRVANSQYVVDSATRRVIEPIKPAGERVPFGCQTSGCYDGSPTDAWDPSDNRSPGRRVEVPWAGDTNPARVAIRAISPSANTMSAYFDVPGPGVLTDCYVNGRPRPLEAGRRSSFAVSVRNTGEATDSFTFTLSALPAGWLASGPVKLTLAPRQESVATFTVTPPASARSVVAPVITGRSETDSSVNSWCSAELDPNAGTNQWAYLWAGEPTVAAYTPDSAYQRSSTGQPATITRSTTGRYAVRLPGLALTGGVVQVSAYGSKGSCRTLGWHPEGADLVAWVQCHSSAGAPADGRFTLSFAAPTSTEGDLAHVWANRPTSASYVPDPLYSYNSRSASNRIQRSAKGQYVVRLNGLGGIGGHVQLTPYGSGTVRCSVAGWSASGSTQTVKVGCRTPAGAAADAMFTMTFARGGAVTGADGADTAYLWSDDLIAQNHPAKESYAFSTTGAEMTISRMQVGEYTVALAGLGGDNGTVHVTPYGDRGIQCSTSYWASFGTKDQRVFVSCFGPKGEPRDSRFTLTYAR